MSGRASGWVLQHGPRAAIGGEKMRPLRAVLLVIADSANFEGAESHPGLNALIELSDYSPSTVKRALRELEAAGWIEVTERGGGRGRSSVFRIPGVVNAPRGKQAQSEPLSRSDAQKQAHEPRETGPETTETGPRPYLDREPNGLPTGTSNGKPPLSERARLARSIVDRVFERKDPKPATNYLGTVKVAEKLLAAGHEAKAIFGAMMEAPTISTGWIESRLNRNGSPVKAHQRLDTDRDTPSGEVVL